MITKTGNLLLRRWIYILIRVGDDYKIPYRQEELEQIYSMLGKEGKMQPFLERFLKTIAEGDWPPGSYYPGGWYRKLIEMGEDPLAADITPENLNPFYQEEFCVTAEGRWFSGEKQIEGKILKFFLENLYYDHHLSRYRIRYRLENHFETRYLHHRSPPFRVMRILKTEKETQLLLNNGKWEKLARESLWMDHGEQLYCAIPPHQIPVWFSEPARWEMLKDAEEGNEGWILNIAGRPFELRTGLTWPYKDILPG